MSDTIPYTHWSYFTDKAAAEACGKEIDLRFDCLTAVDPSAGCPGEWLLRAARTVSLDYPWHDEIAEVVERHGGRYDGGEATYFLRSAPSLKSVTPALADPAAHPSRSDAVALANALGRLGVAVWRINPGGDGEPENMQFTRASRWFALINEPAWWCLQCADGDGGWRDLAPIRTFGHLSPNGSLDGLAEVIVEAVDLACDSEGGDSA